MERSTLICPEATLDSHTLERLCRPFLSAQVEPLRADVGWERLDEPERIRQALIRTQGKVVAAARLLGLSRSALRYRLRRYGIGRSPHLAPDLPHPSPLPKGEGERLVPSPHRGRGSGEGGGSCKGAGRIELHRDAGGLSSTHLGAEAGVHPRDRPGISEDH